jgi:hypothetical protein
MILSCLDLKITPVFMLSNHNRAALFEAKGLLALNVDAKHSIISDRFN